jgi:hypothetical protein
MSNSTIGTDYVIRQNAMRADKNFNDTSAHDTCRLYIKCINIKKELLLHFKSPKKFDELIDKTLKRKECKNYEGFKGFLGDKLDRITSPERIDEIVELIGEGLWHQSVIKIFR